VEKEEKTAKTGRNGFKFEDFSSEEGGDTFCLVCSEQYASHEDWVQRNECKVTAHCKLAGKDPR
jgi:hypothetical protein